MSMQRRKFSKEFKIQIIREIDNGTPVAQLSRQHQIQESRTNGESSSRKTRFKHSVEMGYHQHRKQRWHSLSEPFSGDTPETPKTGILW
jgi:transposase-like protein